MKRFDDVEATLGDDIEIAFTVKDRNDDLVDLTGATATFRVAKKGSTSHILEKTETDGITFASSVATVALNTEDLDCTGVFIGQLRITKSGKAMVAAEGEIRVGSLIE